MSGDYVECRSDHDYVGHPRAFVWLGKRFQVSDVLVQNHTPVGFQFTVRTVDAQLFELDYNTNADEWTVKQP